MGSPLKCYVVREDCEGHCCITFATSNVVARRQGAAELDLDFESVESCRRMPALDRFAPGPVPPKVLIEDHAWWFECNGCGRQVSQELFDYDEDRELTPVYGPGERVWCEQACKERFESHEAQRKAKQDHDFTEALCAFAVQCPYINDARAYYTYRDRKEVVQVVFSIPGADRFNTGHWYPDEPGTVRIAPVDLSAFENARDEWKANHPTPTPEPSDADR